MSRRMTNIGTRLLLFTNTTGIGNRIYLHENPKVRSRSIAPHRTRSTRIQLIQMNQNRNSFVLLDMSSRRPDLPRFPIAQHAKDKIRSTF